MNRGRRNSRSIEHRVPDLLSDKPSGSRSAAYWELLMNLTRREVKGRYSQSLFGVGWAIAQPLATMAVFTLVFCAAGQDAVGRRAVSAVRVRGAGAVVLLLELGELGDDEPGHLSQHRDEDLFPARDRAARAGRLAPGRLLRRVAALFALLMVYYGVGARRRGRC